MGGIYVQLEGGSSALGIYLLFSIYRSGKFGALFSLYISGKFVVAVLQVSMLD